MFEPRLLHHVIEGQGPTIGLAVHAGHEIRADLLNFLQLDELARMREEDPFTDYLAFACHSQFLPRRSRFEVDLNRPREEALCVVPDDCWGLDVWQPEAVDTVLPRAMAEHETFFARLEGVLRQIERRYGGFVLFDLHSYNHRRSGPDAAPAPIETNPEINLGTGTMDRDRWAPLVERFLDVMRTADVCGRKLDVRENVKFRGREVPRFVHERFPETGCALAIEFKKTFMDEWTGAVDGPHLLALRAALESAVRALSEHFEAKEA